MDVAHRAGGDGVGVFDVLGFVQNDGVEIVLFQLFEIPAQQGVGRDDQIGVRYFAEDVFPPGAVDDDTGKVRHEFGRFPIPVGEYGGGHDDQVRAFCAVVDHVLDEGQRLDGFAEAHFVGKNAAEAVFVEEVQIGNALKLIGTQLCRKALRHGNLPDFLKVAYALPQFAPEGIFLRGGEIFQQAVQDGSFVLLELAFGRSGRIEAEYLELVRELFQPRFRQAGIGAVLELDVTLALEPGFPDAFQRQALAAVIHLYVEGEPLVLFVAFDAGVDHGRGGAHLVARQRGLAVHAPVFHKGGVGIQQEGDGLFRLHEPEFAAARLEAHVGKLRDQRGFFRLIPPDQEGFAFKHITAGLEIGIGAGQGELAVYRFINVLDFQREQTALLVEEDLGIIRRRLAGGVHDFENFVLLVQFRRGQARPYPVQKFRNVFLRDQRAVMHQRLNDLMIQTGLDGIETLIPADPQRHLPVERGAFAVRRVCFPLVVAVVHDGEGLFALPLEHDVETQTLFVQRGLELEGHG